MNVFKNTWTALAENTNGARTKTILVAGVAVIVLGVGVALNKVNSAGSLEAVVDAVSDTAKA